MKKEFILSEIKRIAQEHDDAPPGRERFARLTGIKTTDWYGTHLSRWGDAIREAGFTPNERQLPYDELRLVEHLALLARELGRFPVHGEIRMKGQKDKSFPSHNVFEKLGPRAERARKVLDYCRSTPGFDDVAAICELIVGSTEAPTEDEPEDEAPFGFVYLTRMGKHYKIGHTASLGRREYELAIQMPQKLTLIHAIRTDDPAGIEAYWHKRFEDRRGNGEWFDLSAQDVKAFKRRAFM